MSARLAAAAQAEFERLQDLEGLLEATNLLGAIAFERGRIRDAERHFSAVATLAEGQGKPRFVARSANNLGGVASLRGDHRRAASFYQRALDVCEECGETRGMAEACHHLAVVLRESGRPAEAAEYADRAIETAERVGESGLIALTLLGRAAMWIASIDYDRALEDIHRAELLAWAEGNEPHRLEAERLYALIALRRDDPAEAHRRAAVVQIRAAEAQLALLSADARSVAALALKALGRHTEAVAAHEAVTVAFRSLGATGRLERLAREWDSI